jgi:hypothetical protein
VDDVIPLRKCTYFSLLAQADLWHTTLLRLHTHKTRVPASPNSVKSLVRYHRFWGRIQNSPTCPTCDSSKYRIWLPWVFRPRKPSAEAPCTAPVLPQNACQRENEMPNKAHKSTKAGPIACRYCAHDMKEETPQNAR